MYVCMFVNASACQCTFVSVSVHIETRVAGLVPYVWSFAVWEFCGHGLSHLEVSIHIAFANESDKEPL